jgi:hypothetical protein
MRQGYTINWLSEVLSRIGLSLNDIPVLDICALFSDEDLQEMDAEKRSRAVEDAYQLVEEMLSQDSVRSVRSAEDFPVC